ncbi:MAG TPA: amino acid ABC transporter permease [Candidatus Sulfomarinibacteraceae bacterium]|nr:amino acid ABC transporter permease [Candidatus Sulfomarinibacteraceae bacterium]
MSSSSIAAEVERPTTSVGPLRWIHKNLFNTWYNGLLTLLALWVLYKAVPAGLAWLMSSNWAPILSRPLLYFVGQYPTAALWRVGIGVLLISLSFGLSWGTWGGPTRTFAVALMGGYAMVALLPVSLDTIGLVGRLFMVVNIVAVAGGFALGQTRLGQTRWVLALGVLSFAVVVLLLRGVGGAPAMPVVQTTRWGGLMLNLLVAAVGIVASFPLGVLLALGRRSNLPVVKLFSTLFIELVRGVPLITILFMGSLLLPLFLPEEVRIDRLLRAMIGITLFSAAYMAENVRGGLQAIPEGQYDAAKAIGLSGPLTTLLIVLPQALRLVIPAIVGQFIALFKDTTLLIIVGINEILGIGKSIVLGNPEWVTAQKEVYVFIAIVFWVFTYAMSYSSRRLERALGVGER